MIHSSIVNPITEEFIKKAHKIMRDKGYKMKSSKQSATIEYSYVKPGQGYYDGVSLGGWHGDKKYGTLKLMMDIYVKGEHQDDIFLMPGQTKGSYGQGLPVTRFDGLSEEEFEAYKENIKKAEEFLKTL